MVEPDENIIPVYVNTSEKTSPANSMARISRQTANETVEKSCVCVFT
jgi:hypothetical protein